MTVEDLVKYFMEASISGASKTQVRRKFKELYNLNDAQIDKLQKLSKFNKKPRKINYKQFFKNSITTKAQRIYFPFTQIYKKENFLTELEGEQLILMISRDLRPSTVADDGDNCLVNDYRTSKTSDLNYFKDPFYLNIDKKISNLMNLEPFFGETMQAQKYEVGEYYKEHYDFFSPFNHEFKTYCEWMGQRTWTTMVYLNDVEEGGETYFKYLNLKIKPKKGLLIAWNNLYINGFPNYKTMHEALPPLKNSKYIITKWWRSWSLI